MVACPEEPVGGIVGRCFKQILTPKILEVGYEVTQPLQPRMRDVINSVSR